MEGRKGKEGRQSLRFKLNELLTVEELASKLKVSLKTVRSWVYLRRIPFTRFMRRVYFPVDVVEMLLKRNAVAALGSSSSADSKPTGQGGAQTKEVNS